MMLYKLLCGSRRERYDHVVVCLMDKGTLGAKIELLGIPVYSLNMSRGRLSLAALLRMIKIIRTAHPNIIQGWMYHGNLAASVAKVFTIAHPAVLWNIRQSLYNVKLEKILTRIVILLCRYLTSTVDLIIYNSRTSAAQHEALGYPFNKRILLANGFDLELFSPSLDARRKIRDNIGITDGTLVVALFARFHPMKDHVNFFRAASIILSNFPNIHFMLVGRDVNMNNFAFRKFVDEEYGKNNFHFLGERQDIPDIMSAVDINVLSSAWGEGFPNVLGEAMACAIPCVATDVGDSAWILGESGVIVNAGDAKALANAIMKLLRLGGVERVALGAGLRKRVVACYDIRNIVKQYESVYEKVCDGRRLCHN